MSLRLFRSLLTSGLLPPRWTPSRGGVVKYPVRNTAVLRELRRLRSGRWKKVIKQGNVGEAHYFEHESGMVAGVKFISGGKQ